jgi:regulator of sigma E protease
VNILLAIGIYIITLAAWGDDYLPSSEVKYGITVDSLGQVLGLRNGDKILSVDNEVVEDFFRIPGRIILENAKSIQVERDGQKKDIPVPVGFLSKLIKHQSAEFISIRFPFEVADFNKKSIAPKAGIKVGDKIINRPPISISSKQPWAK